MLVIENEEGRGGMQVREGIEQGRGAEVRTELGKIAESACKGVGVPEKCKTIEAS